MERWIGGAGVVQCRVDIDEGEQDSKTARQFQSEASTRDVQEALQNLIRLIVRWGSGTGGTSRLPGVAVELGTAQQRGRRILPDTPML